MRKILFVDDHPIVRQGIIRIIQEMQDLDFEFDEAATGERAITMVIAGCYDLVLLDIGLPDQSGLDVLKKLHQHDPQLPVIILSTYPEEQYAVKAIRLGAYGYINKGSATTELKNAINNAMVGRRYISLTQAELLAEVIHDSPGAKPLHHALTERECQVACLITSGMTLTRIADTLSKSVSTISTYRARIPEKLQLRTTADIINYCLRHKLTM